MLVCPACKNSLRAVTTKQGVVVDHCDSCKGLWLDEGEIFFFTKRPKIIQKELEKGLTDPHESERLCPRCQEVHFVEGSFFKPNLRIDQCPQCHGLWFDDGELKTALDLGEKQFSLTFETSDSGSFYASRPVAKDVKRPQTPPVDFKAEMSNQEKQQKLKIAGLAALPSLALRSTVSFAVLYGALGLILILMREFYFTQWSLWVPMAFTCGLIFLQYLVSPFIMDLTLRWLYDFRWVEPDELPEHLQKFIQETCKNNKMPFPSMGFIEDSAPNAFTYGHTPGNARVVITRGILEYLEPAEVEAVVAHELGHAKHWDILVMTLAAMVPVILYTIYRYAVKMADRARDKAKGPAIIITILAYVLYIVSEYVVLWLSRVREYWADRFAGLATNNPNGLASALVKIAYGLVAPKKQKNTTQEDSDEEEKEENKAREDSRNLAAIQALGIFNFKDAQTLALNSYTMRKQQTGKASNHEEIADAMQWDLWNPWAAYYELHSTHPLPAKRINAMSDQAVAMGQDPFIVFNRQKPESYWDEFFVDVFYYFLPSLALFGGIGWTLWKLQQPHKAEDLWFVGALSLAALAVANLTQIFFSYRGSIFPKMRISSLLSKVKVSAIRPIPVTLKGKVIGKGVPGYMFSEDMVLEDESGIIFMDYRQPFGLWELWFALMRSDEYIGQEVTVEGWYRRSPVPYIEIKNLHTAGNSFTCYVYHMKIASNIMLLVGAVAMLIAAFK